MLLTILTAVPAAYAYSRFRSPGLTSSAFFLLAIRMFPPIVISIPLYPALNYLGVIDTHLLLIIIYTAMMVSLSTFIMKAFIDEIPRELDEAARIDGCNTVTVLTRMILPLSAHGTVTVALFTAVFAWNEFMFAFLFSGSQTRTAPMTISEMLGAVTGVEWGPLFAAATLQLVPVILLVFGLQRFLVRGLTLGATKG